MAHILPPDADTLSHTVILPLRGHLMKLPLSPDQDAFGAALREHHEGRNGVEIVERSDGYIDVASAAASYFAEPIGSQAEIADRARGRVLDVGSGAGRYALYLQERGREVVAIDASPAAVDLCRARGIRDARLLTLDQVDDSLGRFDTVLMMGNNFGLFGSEAGARRLLPRLRDLMSPGGRLIAETMDPYQSQNPDHLEYHSANRARGRMGGQIRMRIRHKALATPWFDYLFVSREELRLLLEGTGWRVEEILDLEGPGYVAILAVAADE